MYLSLVKAPEVQPVSLSEARDFLRIDHTDEDQLIDRLIKAATQRIDGPYGRIGRCLIDQTWSLTLEEHCRELEISLTPVLSIVSVSGMTNVDYTTHRLKTLDSAILRPAHGGAWWSRNTVEQVITFRAGFGETPDDVPEPIRAAILMHVAHLYEHRESVISGETLIETLQGYEDLLLPYRVWRF